MSSTRPLMMIEQNMRKLTTAQWELLDRICRSNGGGVTVGISDGAEFSRAQALYKKGLAQGKSGQQYKVVHTTEGLAYWRNTIKPAIATTQR